jgi:hypothetical protein
MHQTRIVFLTQIDAAFCVFLHFSTSSTSRWQFLSASSCCKLSPAAAAAELRGETVTVVEPFIASNATIC